MDAMDRLNMRSEYQILNDAIKDEIRRSASSVVSLGYMLRRMMDEKLWEGHYDSLDEYLRQELHMDYTLACRFEAINRKYSIGGKNVHIADKWENYSQSVLIEMLNMPPELETKVTPDMTVRQVRELKRQARQEKEKERDEEAAGKTAEEVPRPQAYTGYREVPEETDQDSPAEGSRLEGTPQGEILDAEFREVEIPAEGAVLDPEPGTQEKVATSQLKKSAYRLQKTNEGNTLEGEQGGGIKNRQTEVKQILEKERKMLDDCMKAAAEDKEFSESLMFRRQVIIVDALTAMVDGMEEAGTEPESEEKEQPHLPPLKNNDRRREWLNSYKDWGLWYRDENIGVDYYRYEFDNGACLIAEVYQEEATKYHDAYESVYLHLVGGPKPRADQHGICKWQRHGKYCRYPNSETELVEFLKEVQRNG